MTERDNAIESFFASQGSSAEQIADAKLVLALDSANNLIATGKPLDDEESKRYLVTTKPHLFPGAVDPDDLALARAGNQTARSRIFKALGSVEKTDALIAAHNDIDPAKDVSSNPFLLANFRENKAAQQKVADLIRRFGTPMVARLAKAAGKTLTGTPLKGRAA